MLSTLLRAVILTLVVGLPSIWLSTGPPNRGWWPPDPLFVILATVLLGVLVILKRQRRRGIPIAAIFAVVMFAFLFWVGFLMAFRKGLVEL